MPTVDELRGVPQGNTTKDKYVAEALKKAAVTMGVTVATMAPAAAQDQQTQEPADNHHKIEVVENNVSETNKQEDSNSIGAYNDYADEYQQNKEQTVSQDIKVTHDDGGYLVEGSDGSYAVFTEEELNNKIVRSENKEHRENFSEPTKHEEVILDNAEDLIDANIAEYKSKGNTIISYDTTLSSEDIKKQAEASENSGIDYEKAYEAAKSFEYIKEHPEVKESVIIHEETHRDDYVSGALKSAQITHEQAAKLNMAIEIKATMAQVKLLYDECKKTGNMDALHGWNAGGLTEFKEWYKQNPDSPEVEQRLAKAVCEGWLKENNQKGSSYYEQALDAAHMQSADVNVGEKVAGAKFENTANIKQYHEQWNTLFKNTAFGDVTAVVNADFELGAGAALQSLEQKAANKSGVDKFLEKVVDGSKSVRSATKKLAKFLKKVKKIDKDGVRTPEEEAKLQDDINKIQTKRGVTKYVEKAKKSEGTTKVNTQTNTNAPDMQTIIQQGKGRV